VLPLSDTYAWIIRFRDAASDDWLDMWVSVRHDTSEVYFQVFRNYPSTFDTVASQTYIPGLVYTPGKKLGIRLAHVAGLVVAKVWDHDNDDEPIGWMVYGQDVRGSFTGVPELRTNLSVGNTNGTVVFSLHSWEFKDVRWLGDLTTQLNGSFTVSHSIDDGMPSAVTSSNGGDPQVSAEVALIGRNVYGVEMDARQYFSPFNTDSPVYGFSRDVASVHLDHGLVTDNGIERVRLLTGQMTNVVITGREAALEAVSRSRIKLAKGVLPPIVNGPVEGSELTWLVAYLLWATGVEVAPPTNDDTIQIYIPGAGSMRPFVPYQQGGTVVSTYAEPFVAFDDPIHPTFRDGPFVRAIDSLVDHTVGRKLWFESIGFRHRVDGEGAHFLTQSNPRARMEFWLFGARVWPAVDAAMASPGDALAYFRLENGVQCAVQLTVHQDRQLHWQVEDFAAPIRRFWTGLTLPADDQWHHIGMYYDISTATFRVHVDGSERTFTPSPAFDVEDLDEVDDGVSWPSFWSVIPYAEIRLHTGDADEVDPQVVGWDSTQTRTAGTVIATEDWEDTTYAVTWQSDSWARDNTQAFAGTWSLKSGTIAHMGTSRMLLTLPVNTGEIGFKVRLSTELENDFFNIYDPFLHHVFATVEINGWGTPEIGPALSYVEPTMHASNGTVGQHVLNVTTTEPAAWVDTGRDDGEIEADISFGTVNPTGAPIRIRLRGRGTGNLFESNIYAQLELDQTNTVRLQLVKRVNTVATAISSAVVLGTNGAGTGHTWRVRFWWSGQYSWAEASNISVPGSPNTVTGTTTDLPTGQRVYITAQRVGGNTSGTVTVTYDNVMINGQPLYGGSGPVNAWHDVVIPLPDPAPSKLVFRYRRDETGTSGSDAVWIDDLQLRQRSVVNTTWEPQGIVRGIEFDFQAIVEEGPREAWEWLMSICQSSMTMMRVDELDRVLILPPRYFIEADQLVIADTLTTTWNAKDPDVTLDPSRIRNSVQVDFEEATVDTAQALLLSYKTAFAVAAGVRRFTFSLDIPAVSVVETMTVSTVDVANIGSSSLIWVNRLADGSGAVVDPSQFTARVVSWDAKTVTVEFDNRIGVTVYVVHGYGTDTPYMTIAGRGVHTNQASVSVSAVQGGRPERTVTVQAPELQTRAAARQLAASLLVWTSRPRPGISLTVLGDPRRQPGDLYQLQDPEGIKITGQWRAMSIAHSWNGGGYSQGISVQQVLPVSLWDDGATGWDEGVWS
jgi:hypothetical protein